ncbi:MAG: cytochrome c-type biogenesis protein CcmH [Chloroflexota bacterium]
MRRWLAPVAAGALLAVAVVGALVLPRSAEPTTGERADALARELRCPDCQGLSVADSPTQSAAEIRRQIDALLASGASSDDVRAHFVERYGEWILLAPASPALWAVPFVVLALGAAALVAWLVRARRRPRPAASRPDDDMRRRLREEAEAIDA